MSEATIVKSFRFEAGHILLNHGGSCSRLHGHSYRVDVGVSGDIVGGTGDSDEGMVMDFGKISEAVEDLLHLFDHRTLWYEGWGPAPSRDPLSDSFVALPYVPTAENIARHFYEELTTELPGLAFVRVWETPTSCAEYRRRTNGSEVS